VGQRRQANQRIEEEQTTKRMTERGRRMK